MTDRWWWFGQVSVRWSYYGRKFEPRTFRIGKQVVTHWTTAGVSLQLWQVLPVATYSYDYAHKGSNDFMPHFRLSQRRCERSKSSWMWQYFWMSWCQRFWGSWCLPTHIQQFQEKASKKKTPKVPLKRPYSADTESLPRGPASTAVLSWSNTDRPGFVIETGCVSCEVGTHFL